MNIKRARHKTISQKRFVPTSIHQSRQRNLPGHILFLFFLGISPLLKAQSTLPLKAAWETDGRILTIECHNQSKDTLYVSDLSLSRSKGKSLPDITSGEIDIDFYLLTKSGKTKPILGENTAIFLGSVAIPPHEKQASVYQISKVEIRKLTVEFSTIAPWVSYDQIRTLELTP